MDVVVVEGWIYDFPSLPPPGIFFGTRREKLSKWRSSEILQRGPEAGGAQTYQRENSDGADVKRVHV